MKIRRVLSILLVGVIFVSCSEKAESDRNEDPNVSEPKRESTAESEAEKAGEENELQPLGEEITEDCVAFVRATKVMPARTSSADCPECLAEGTELLTFQQIQTDRISCSADSCEIAVTIRAFFNPGSGETISGGLTAWIPAEQRDEYLRGRIPVGEQVYRVKIIYKRTNEGWRPIEFDKADPE